MRAGSIILGLFYRGLSVSFTYRCSVCREIPSILQISVTDVLVSAYNFLANLILSGDSAFGRPPTFPLVLAASSPALVRSLMMSRSNSASAPKMWKINFPPEVVVSMFSVRLLKPILRSLSSVMRVMRSLRERPSLSSFQTTRVSPGLIYARASERPFRSASALEAVSDSVLQLISLQNSCSGWFGAYAATGATVAVAASVRSALLRIDHRCLVDDLVVRFASVVLAAGDVHVHSRMIMAWHDLGS